MPVFGFNTVNHVITQRNVGEISILIYNLLFFLIPNAYIIDCNFQLHVFTIVQPYDYKYSYAN